MEQHEDVARDTRDVVVVFVVFERPRKSVGKPLIVFTVAHTQQQL